MAYVPPHTSFQQRSHDFVVIYRWQIHKGRESDFRQAWKSATEAIRDQCGSGGSALFRCDDETFVAIARWPSREARERCDAAADDIARMASCVAERFPSLMLTALENLWTS